MFVSLFPLQPKPKNKLHHLTCQTIALISFNSCKYPFYLLHLSWFKARLPTEYFCCQKKFPFFLWREYYLTNIYHKPLAQTLLYSLYVCYLCMYAIFFVCILRMYATQADPGPGLLKPYISCYNFALECLHNENESVIFFFLLNTQFDPWVSKNP